MPFAGYTDFMDCVSKNQDKRNPRAYCSQVMHDVEGRKFNVRVQTGAQVDGKPVYGYTDFQEGEIVLDPSRGDLVNTIIHERLHAEHPEMTEKQVQRQAMAIESRSSIRDMRVLLQDVENETERSARNTVNTVASNVQRQRIHKGRR